MKVKRIFAGALALALLLSLAACGEKGTAVYVQSVRTLAAMGGIAPGDRFPGMVVSVNVAEINKDSEMAIEELLVKEGDDVTEGQELFRYDTEQLSLTLDKQRLELEQLQATIESTKKQIEQLTKERDRVWGNDKLQYTVQIQTLEVDLKETELKVKTKEQEISQSEKILENTSVVSPVTGRIQSISENGTDNYGNPLPYITIQQSGSYRVKGTLGELQRGGIMEGSRMKLFSRTNREDVWYGTVTLVDYENPAQGNEYEMYYGNSSDSMMSSSKYPFYVELDSTEGLILGQHLYLELDNGEESTGLNISGAFLCYEEDGTVYVWAESDRGKLEKRPVELGAYNGMMDTHEILSGLTEEDYIAFPDPELCIEGAPTTREEPQPEEPEGGES